MKLANPFKRIVVLVPLFPLLSAVVGCHPAVAPPPDRPQHVIVVVFDSLRADHLGCYGYERDTSPFIDSLARESVLFTQAYSNSSYTRESVSSYFLGLRPSRSAWGTGWEALPHPDMQGMAALFKQAGYHTGFFSNTLMLNPEDFRRGFDEYEGFMHSAGLSGLGPLLTQRAVTFMREHKDKNTFLYLHYFDPHSPYEPPDTHYLRFADERFPEPLTLRDHIRDNLPELVADGFGPGDPRFEDFKLRYDAEIAFEDESFESLFVQLKAMGTLDNALIVFTSDHGEEFLEHGFLEHAWQVYPESLHVPLLFWWPSGLTPERVEAPVELADLLPTLAALATLPPIAHEVDGAPLFQRKSSGWNPAPQNKPIISETLIPMRNMARSIIHEGYQYIAAPRLLTVEKRCALWNNSNEARMAFLLGEIQTTDPWGAPQYEALYNLRNDPGATLNIADVEPEKRDRFRTLLDEYRRRCPEPVSEQIKAARNPEALTREMREALASIGYLPAEVAPIDDSTPPSSDETDETEEILRGLGYL